VSPVYIRVCAYCTKRRNETSLRKRQRFFFGFVLLNCVTAAKNQQQQQKTQTYGCGRGCGAITAGRCVGSGGARRQCHAGRTAQHHFVVRVHRANRLCGCGLPVKIGALSRARGATWRASTMRCYSTRHAMTVSSGYETCHRCSSGVETSCARRAVPPMRATRHKSQRERQHTKKKSYRCFEHVGWRDLVIATILALTRALLLFFAARHTWKTTMHDGDASAKTREFV
jgi:hypothetical protein